MKCYGFSGETFTKKIHHFRDLMMGKTHEVKKF